MCVIRKLTVLVYQEFECGEGLVGTGIALLFPDGHAVLTLTDFKGEKLPSNEYRIAVQDEISVHPMPTHPKLLTERIQ